VIRLLSSVHGEESKTIPQPYLAIFGYNKIPSVLDGLIHALLSAYSRDPNSSQAFENLVKWSDVLQSGIDKGGVNWDAVRRADVSEIFTKIKSANLAEKKSNYIKNILQMVHEENQARLSKFATMVSDEVTPTEVLKAESNVLSLDHLHSLTSEDAFSALVKFPGIGLHCASRVLLFFLQRPCFPIGTHGFRISKRLGWVPPDKATRNSTFAHLQVRIPEEYKYRLHQLFLKHGQACVRCGPATGKGTAGWGNGCVIDHLLKRPEGRKSIESG